MRKLLLITVLLITVMLTACIPDDVVDISIELNPGLDTVEINTAWEDAGAVAILGEQRFNITTSDIPDTSTLGVKEVEYTYTTGGKGYSISRFVTIVDTTQPVLELNAGVDTVALNGTWEDAGVIVTDNSGETLTAVVTGTVNTFEAGTYGITYTATDSSGNTQFIVRFVTVLE